jgi:hypothetical protein
MISKEGSVTLNKSFVRQPQECRIVFYDFTPSYGVPCKGTGMTTKQTLYKNTGLKPKQKSKEYLE